jgi:STE24 endopeptidase
VIKLQFRINGIWLVLIVLSGVFSLLYLWFTLFPGRVVPEVGHYFSAEQINRGRQYHRIPQLMFIINFLVQTALLGWLVFGGRAADLSHWLQQVTGGSFWGSLLLFFFTLWLWLQLCSLPFTYYSSYFWQHYWGFSTQTPGSWWMDYFKNAGLSLCLSAIGVVLLFWMMGHWPRTWWLAGATFVSIWLVIQAFFWPVVVAPLFNRFVPAKDPAVLNMVQELSQQAQLTVDQVLIMDGSRRTTKANAYFAGLGRTKRIVLYDTLLTNYSLDEHAYFYFLLPYAPTGDSNLLFQ